MSSSLPIRTTVDDIVALCIYLAAKPIGATMAEAKTVIEPGVLDGRKTSAMKFWGLIEDVEGRLKLTELGRALAKEIRRPQSRRAPQGHHCRLSVSGHC